MDQNIKDSDHGDAEPEAQTAAHLHQQAGQVVGQRHRFHGHLVPGIYMMPTTLGVWGGEAVVKIENEYIWGKKNLKLH